MRFFSFRRWRPRELVGWWIVYWVLLVVVGLRGLWGPLWRLMREGKGGSTASVALNASSSTGISLTLSLSGRTLYAGSISLVALALWIAIPPLLAWLAWVAARQRDEAAREVV
ncbi:MAG: hypothetical protein ACREMU_14815 [Gemmatimonadaceae bacterium]